MGDQLLLLPLTERSVHLCADVQRIFSAEVLGRRHRSTGSCRGWRVAARECIDLRLLELLPLLAALCPPATVIDKTGYSALAEPKLAEHLRQRLSPDEIPSKGSTAVTAPA
jgi:hypothetical protein